MMNSFPGTTFLASTFLIAMIAAPSSSAGAQDISLSKTIGTCEGCHGPGGNSVTTTTPRLNAQLAPYLIARFNSFRDPTTQSPHATDNMWPITSQTTAKILPELAQYFATQQPTEAQAKAPLASEGKRIYLNGTTDVPACQKCHGEHAEGRGSIPRLAGQHRDYLKSQLLVLSLILRDSKIMHPNAVDMTEEQMNAIAEYLGNN